MNKKQIYISCVAIGLVAVLFTLPKVIVKNESPATSENRSETSKLDSSEQHEEHTHELTLEKDQVKIVNSLKSLFVKETENKNKLRMVDSIARIFQSKFMYDSAAIYLAIHKKIQPSLEAIELEGDNFLDAFNFATDQNKATEYSEKAQKSYEEILAQVPDNLDVKSKLAMTYVASPNPMKGIMLLRENLEKNPTHKPTILNLGLLAIQSGQFDKAAKRFEDLVKLDPLNSKAYFYLGIAYKELGKNELAKQNFTKVKQLDSDPEVVATVDGYMKELK